MEDINNRSIFFVNGETSELVLQIIGNSFPVYQDTIYLGA